MILVIIRFLRVQIFVAFEYATSLFIFIKETLAVFEALLLVVAPVALLLMVKLVYLFADDGAEEIFVLFSLAYERPTTRIVIRVRLHIEIFHALLLLPQHENSSIFVIVQQTQAATEAVLLAGDSAVLVIKSVVFDRRVEEGISRFL